MAKDNRPKCRCEAYHYPHTLGGGKCGDMQHAAKIERLEQAPSKPFDPYDEYAIRGLFAPLNSGLQRY